MTRRGRPRRSLGQISRAVLSLAELRPVTSADIARELQLSRAVARDTVSRLCSTGLLREHAHVRMSGSDKPLRQVVAARVETVQQVHLSLTAWQHKIVSGL